MGGQPFASILAPVRAHLAAEVARQPVDGAADVSQLIPGREAFNVAAVPQHPSSQRGQHQQGACRGQVRSAETTSIPECIGGFIPV